VGNILKKRPDMAAGLAPEGFDLDQISPEIAEELAAELARFIRELQDSEARQRARQILVIIHRSISSM
jgi:hypothetical protein